MDGTTLTWTTEFESNKLETAVLNHCHNLYRKALSSQFGHGTMQDLLGFNGVSETATQILAGTLFDKLYRKECGIVFQLTLKSRNKLFAKESMAGKNPRLATSPSGRHLGHYKAALQDTQLTGGYQMMLNIPVQHGFAPTRC